MTQLVQATVSGRSERKVGKGNRTYKVLPNGTWCVETSITTQQWDRQARQMRPETEVVRYYGLAASVIPYMWPDGPQSDKDRAAAAYIANPPDGEDPIATLADYSPTAFHSGKARGHLEKLRDGQHDLLRLVCEDDMRTVEAVIQLLPDLEKLDRDSKEARDLLSEVRSALRPVLVRVRPYPCAL